MAATAGRNAACRSARQRFGASDELAADPVDAGAASRSFVLSFAGATVFAIATVASSFAIRWTIDNVILPRFEDGEVDVQAFLVGAGMIIGIGLIRAVGVVFRRRSPRGDVAGRRELHEPGARPSRSPAGRAGTGGIRTETSSPAPASTPRRRSA